MPTSLSHVTLTFTTLALATAVVFGLEIEKAAGLGPLMAIVTCGWVVHALLPTMVRPALFLGLSVLAIVVKLGWDSITVLALGLALLGLAYLPAKPIVRIGAVVVAVAGLALIRVGAVEVDFVRRVLPVLAAMFMFRLILLLREPAPNVDWVSRLSYMFMLTNAAFPVFPIVDWGNWRKAPTTPLEQLHQRGLQWIVRGLLHLLGYRLVYHLWVPPGWEVVDAASVLQWIFAGYLLYLRISGQFHLIVGVLLLFDKELPETHHLYYLSSSFNDYWRRVNTYWTHFVEKLVFYPAFLRLRRAGVPQPLVVAILLTFVATWTLHAWQWFWLRGEFLLTWTDASFWAILGTCLAANSVWEARSGKAPASGPTLGAAVALSAQTVGFFCLMALLWSYWFSEDIPAWISRMETLSVEPEALVSFLFAVTVAIIGGVVLQAVLAVPAVDKLRKSLDGEWSAGVSVATATGLLLLAFTPRDKDEPPWVRSARDAIASERLNRQDMIARTQGYYEGLQPRGSLMDEVWRGDVQRPASWVPLNETEFVLNTGRPPLLFEMLPNKEGRFQDAEFITNSHAMRDDEYTKEKPPNTVRIILLGASHETGAGVGTGEFFEPLLEERLVSEERGGVHYEVLNFSVYGYAIPQLIAQYQLKAREFQPDVVLMAAHTVDGMRTARYYSVAPWFMTQSSNPDIRAMGDRIWQGAQSIQDVMRVKMSVEARLMEGQTDILPVLYQEMAQSVIQDGAIPMWMFVPLTEEDGLRQRMGFDLQSTWAVQAGMIPLDLRRAYEGFNKDELRVAPWDDHPNRMAHKQLADVLYDELHRADREHNLGLFR